jgi:hypothetical protein
MGYDQEGGSKDKLGRVGPALEGGESICTVGISNTVQITRRNSKIFETFLRYIYWDPDKSYIETKGKKNLVELSL